MKFWLEAVLEDGDTVKKCGYCGKALFIPDHIFVECLLIDCGDLHPEPTGQFKCANCAKLSLI
jgi:hypothetical protein